MGPSLVIVESPAKAKTIARYLGAGFVVESSIGHIRDLPRKAADVPAAYKKEKWARLGVDTDNDFKPLYVVTPEKKEQVRHLKAALKDADELYLATDEDREGEAIAWHLLEVLSPRVPVKRMVFHEITPEAIRAAVENPRELDRRLVDAQEARRILDRLYGYEVSPVLWKKVMPRLSAGRVQSVATRIIVQRERERMKFRSASYWDLSATFTPADREPVSMTATLVEVDGRRLATGRDFSSEGELAADQNAGTAPLVLGAAEAEELRSAVDGNEASVRSVERKPYTRRPAAPFMTSTIQQEASRKLRYSAATTMSVAQRLYENGYITYMRTDSTSLSDTAIAAARSYITERFGEAYRPDEPRRYTKKVKNAQEAHEAIRPAGDRFRSPDQVRSELGNQEFRLYELIWQRTVASQMSDARGESVNIRVGSTITDGRELVFSATGRTIQFPGFLKVYADTAEDGENPDQPVLPDLAQGRALVAGPVEAKGHETQPPARYTEASLVKRLEELGVGRPSTYASIISTVQDRGYVWKRGTALVPSFTAFAVVSLLEGHFPDLVDYAFTARMEDDLDQIASGETEAIPWLSRFYFGAGTEGLGLRKLVSDDLSEIDARDVNSIPIGVDSEGRPVVARVGRYGAYVERVTGVDPPDRATIPEDLPPDELTIERAVELLSTPREGRELGDHPEFGLPVTAKAGRFGPYVAMDDPDGGEKPRVASLFATMDLASVTLEDAVKLLSLPRVLGVDPASGEEITAQNGRFGPYLRKGADSRSLDSEDQIFSVSLEEALRIYAEPKRRRGQTAAAPLADLGLHPDTGRPMVVKDGRFGLYVTDGEVNASLRKGDTVEHLTVDRALELLAERRAKIAETGGAPARRGARKAPAKKAAAKKAPARKAPAKKVGAKKAPAKKVGAKKVGAKKAGDGAGKD